MILKTYKDLKNCELVELAIKNNEGIFADNGALVVETGIRTGRSPKDKFIVKEASTQDLIDWSEINQPISEEVFTNLWEKAQFFLDNKNKFLSNLHIGADIDHYLPLEVVTETAWHQLFATNLFICPKEFNPKDKKIWQLVSLPNFECSSEDGVNSDACVLTNFSKRKVLILGMKYAGEIKKAMFGVQNFLLPEKDVLPMHCAANAGEDGDVCLFFGLSGTGKTTLSADENRFLIGDDEHGWGEGIVFNLEGGCYAKAIDLRRESEPLIWDAIGFGTILENVVLDKNKTPDYSNSSLTENTRAAYPLKKIPQRVLENYGGEPNNIIFLTCDMSGVLPPVAFLSKEAAAYHFLSGYTARVGSTEIGSVESLEATFSACFGAPFFPRPPAEYASLLMKRIEEYGSEVYLVNTGYSGGAYGAGGQRFTIEMTRAIITSIHNGSIKKAPKTYLSQLNLTIPTEISNVNSNLLNPETSWKDKSKYAEARLRLIESFKANFTKYKGVEETILKAGVGEN